MRIKQAQKKSSTQESILAYINAAQRKLTPDQLAQKNFLLEMLSTVLDEDTGKLMEYWNLMENPKYRNLYRNSYAKEIGQLSQEMSGLV